jgi:hypothetical protein
MWRLSVRDQNRSWSELALLRASDPPAAMCWSLYKIPDSQSALYSFGFMPILDGGTTPRF